MNSEFPYLDWMREQGVEETLANYLEIAGIPQEMFDNWTDADDIEYGVLIPPHLKPHPSNHDGIL